MRDLHLRHTLKALARDASGVFADLVESGQEIPYEIGEPGESFAFCQYRPLSARFVRDNATELRELESFREAVETMRRTEIAAAYLEEAAISPPADPVERATLAVTYFLARLWDGCSEFELDGDRFDAAIDEIEQCAEPEEGEVEAIVPLIGLKMEESRLDLQGAAIVRADTVDVPPEAGRSERADAGPWEPTYLISAQVALDEDGGLGGAGERVAMTFERVITTLRLLKPGGIALGPHGWVRVAGDRWRRISTGAGRPRPGGYRLDSTDHELLADLSRTISVHPRRVGSLRRALLRFETGLDRRGAVDALNDHLLALRFLLEGEGPAGVGLPMRVAALAAEAEERPEIKQTVESAIALERELYSGEPPKSEDGRSPAEVAAAIEDLLRTILRRGVSGELGPDLRTAADRTLLADGVAVGDGAGEQLGGTTEWELEPALAETGELEAIEEDDLPEQDPFEGEPAEDDLQKAEPAEIEIDEDELLEDELEEDDDRSEDEMPIEKELPMEDFDIAEGEEILVSRGPTDDPDHDPDEMPAPEPEREPLDAEAFEAVEAELFDAEPVEASAPVQRSQRNWRAGYIPFAGAQLPAEGESEPAKEDEQLRRPVWLAEVDSDATMDFPAPSNHLRDLARPPMDRDEVRARVAYLFPRTETNWTVGKKTPDRNAAAG